MSKQKDLGLSSQEYEDAVILEKLFSIVANTPKCSICRKRKPTHLDCNTHKLICQSCAKGRDNCKEVGADRIKSSDLKKLERHAKSSDSVIRTPHRDRGRSRQVRSPSFSSESEDSSDNYRSHAHSHSNKNRSSPHIQRKQMQGSNVFEDPEFTPGMRGILASSSTSQQQPQLQQPQLYQTQMPPQPQMDQFYSTPYLSQLQSMPQNNFGIGTVPSNPGQLTYPSTNSYAYPNVPSFGVTPANPSATNLQNYMYSNPQLYKQQSNYPQQVPPPQTMNPSTSMYNQSQIQNPQFSPYAQNLTNQRAITPFSNAPIQPRSSSFTPNYMNPQQATSTRSHLNPINLMSTSPSNAPFTPRMAANPFNPRPANQTTRSSISNNPFAN